jgi:hypothetical protein
LALLVDELLEDAGGVELEAEELESDFFSTLLPIDPFVPFVPFLELLPLVEEELEELDA